MVTAKKKTTTKKAAPRKAAPRKAAVPKTTVDPERVCPGCGEFHASSIIPEVELAAYVDQGVKASALPPSASYRMFVCNDGTFHAVPHKEGS